MTEQADDRARLRSFDRIEAMEAGWYDDFSAQVRAGRPYILSTLVIPHEFFLALDLLWLEDLALVKTIKPLGHYESMMDSLGFSSVIGIPGFGGGLAAGGLSLALALDSPDRELWNDLPPPAAVITTAADRSAQLVADHYDIPCLIVEMPALVRLNPAWWMQARWDWEDLDQSYRIDMVLDQFNAIIGLCEDIAGRRMDRERLRHILDLVNIQEHIYDEIRGLTCQAPKMPYRMREAERICMALQRNRGAQWAVDEARHFRDEVRERIDAEQWLCPHERHRLMWNGSYTRINADVLDALQDSHGVVFARALWLSIGPDGYLREGGAPLRALASRYTTMHNQAHIPPLSFAWSVEEARRHRINGAIHQVPWERYDYMSAALEVAGIPVLKRATPAARWDKATMHRELVSFIEDRLTPID